MKIALVALLLGCVSQPALEWLQKHGMRDIVLVACTPKDVKYTAVRVETGLPVWGYVYLEEDGSPPYHGNIVNGREANGHQHR